MRVSGGVCSPQQASKVVLGFSGTVEHTILTTLSYFTPPNEPHKPNYGDGGAALLLAPVGDDVGGLLAPEHQRKGKSQKCPIRWRETLGLIRTQLVVLKSVTLGIQCIWTYTLTYTRVLRRYLRESARFKGGRDYTRHYTQHTQWGQFSVFHVPGAMRGSCTGSSTTPVQKQAPSENQQK